MSNKLGLISKNNDVISSMVDNFALDDLVKYRTIEAVRGEEVDILMIDFDFFDDLQTVQFHLSKIRKKIHGIPVILIFRSNREPDVNFQWFFDDFLLFPFRKGEIDLRVRQQLTAKIDDDSENLICVGNLKIDIKEYSVYRSDEKLEFTYKEFELLRFMLENRGHTFSRKELLNRIWGMEYIGGTRTVDVHIRRLRSKLGDDFNSLIDTVRNVGYRCIS